MPQLVEAWHKKRSTVITFNYDTLIEKVFGRERPGQARLDYTNLYPIPPTTINLRRAGTFGSSPLDTFSLLKLHGSINWCFSGATSYFGEPIYDLGIAQGWEVDESLDGYRAKAPDKQPLIVPPTLTKSAFFENETVRANWRLAGDALSQAHRVYCIGYSLPTGDLPTRLLLRRCTAGIEVVPVDVASDLDEHYAGQLPSVLKVIGSYTGNPNAVEDFVASWAATA